ncbi:MAG: molybdopterin-dependent oxidoreductase [Sphingomonadales bacterium]|nr:molybdopterin-dependent oxidoreductase [Sphingomonadales bacterium]MBD3772661.1 molybdopterin-dependent oxidoreductase [Paracoccaceae bacterium]
MERIDSRLAAALTRRRLLASAGASSAAIATMPLWAQSLYDLGLPGKPSTRPLTTTFPTKGEMILHRTRPPLLETPMEVFNDGVFTPNDRFFVRWHWASVPDSVDAASFRLKIHGHVDKEIELTLDNLLNDYERIEYPAINQCSGNSRGLFEPYVIGGEWGNGAMGNAMWTGVRLKDVLEKAGVKQGAVDVRFAGLDEALMPDAPQFMKSLKADHAMDGEVMIAFAMNGEQLPLLNGFPIRLIVPGWYSTYWVKMLASIEVLDHEDDQFWMAKAYKIPDTPNANVAPGTKDFPKVAINKMVPRSFVTNLKNGDAVAGGKPLAVSGIAMGGDTGVAKVEISTDGGKSWAETTLGKDEGKYGFRRFDASVDAPATGSLAIMVRCTNSDNIAQPMDMVWNPGGYMQCGVETVTVTTGEKA